MMESGYELLLEATIEDCHFKDSCIPGNDHMQIIHFNLNWRCVKQRQKVTY